MSGVASVLEQNEAVGGGALGVSGVRQEVPSWSSLQLGWRVAEVYAPEEEDFRVFSDLCDAFNGLARNQLDDPFGAKPFRYLHEDVELQDYPGIPGATWHQGHAGALQWTMNLWESFGDFHLEPQEFIRAPRGRFVCVTATVGQGRRSGLQLSLTAYAVVTVEGDKIRRIAITADRQEALKFARVSE
ncbi:MAG TPA: nuclear transport factor 2 family protein [Solirubrobacterales bacterium]